MKAWTRYLLGLLLAAVLVGSTGSAIIWGYAALLHFDQTVPIAAVWAGVFAAAGYQVLKKKEEVR